MSSSRLGIGMQSLGHIKAQTNLGTKYATGLGIDKDDDQAVFWFKKAAQKGYSLAQNSLGLVDHYNDS